MAVFSVDIEKRLGSEFWTNRYLVNQANIADAIGNANQIVGFERDIHSNTVTFTRHRVSNLGEGNEQYVITPIGTLGTRTNQGSLLPLFNTLRLDGSVATGRPSRKYYRGVLGENDIQGDLITSEFGAFATDLGSASDPVTGLGVVDPQGLPILGWIVISFVQMRQLRRSRRRRSQGGIFP